MAALTATRLTAPGRGAVACVRLQGCPGEANCRLDERFRSPSGIEASTAPINRILFGTWQGEEVIVVRTAEQEWEVHCHGGEAAVTRVMADFDATPDQMATPDSDLAQLLLQTTTPHTATLLLAQMNGCLQQELQFMADTTSDDEFAERLTQLLARETVARHLTEPWRVVIAGPPNVGKSSLLNALAGYERSIVYDQPGTTRDAVQTELVLGGWPFRIIDTAGLRDTSADPVEAQGIRFARTLLNSAELVLLAVDHTTGWQDAHTRILTELPSDIPRAAVLCKADLPADGPQVPDHLTRLHTSARTATGIRELADWLPDQLVNPCPTPTTPLPVGAAAELCRSLLEQRNQGQALEPLQRDLSDWLNRQNW